MRLPQTSRRWLTVAAALLSVVAATRLLGDQQYLELPGSPHGLRSLELARTDSAANAIVDGWKKDTLDTRIYSECKACSPFYTNRDPAIVNSHKIQRVDLARTDILWDFALIAGCTWLAIALILFLERRSRTPRPGLAWPVFLAAVCGLIPGIGMLGLLTTGRVALIPPAVYSLFAIAKFALLVALLAIYLPVRLFRLGYLARASSWIGAKTQQLWRYRVIVITIALFSLPLWLSDQGQDLLINVNGSEWGAVLFLALITVAAFLNWWLAKLFFPDEYCGPVLPFREQHLADETRWLEEKKASHFLGVMTFVLPAFSLLQALKDFRISYGTDFFPPMIWLGLVTGLYFFVIRQNLILRVYQKLIARPGRKKIIDRRVLWFLTLPPAITVLVRFWVPMVTGTARSPRAITWLAFDLILLSISFLVFVSLRTYLFPARAHRLRDFLGYPILIAAIAFSVLFLAANVQPVWFSTHFTWNYICLPVLFCGLVFYLLFFTLLLRLGKWRRTNFVSLLFVLCFAANMAVKSPYHDVRFVPGAARDSASLRRPSLEQYFADWVLHRKAEIDGAASYPVFLLNSYGGGIKAAAFTALAVRHLDNSVAAQAQDARPFEHFVFSCSGASGGSIGFSVLAAYRYAELTGLKKTPMTDSTLTAFFNRDFLTGVLMGMLGRDLWAASTATHFWADRSAVQEGIWEKNMADSWGAPYDRDFYSYWPLEISSPAAYEVPLFFSNTTNVDNGLKGIACPVTLDPAKFPVTDLLATQIPAGQSIAMSTAAFLSARFPFISPAGKTNDGYHFIDGGVVDNSGAGTSMAIGETIWALQQLPQDSLEARYPGLYCRLHKISLYFVSISNSSHSKSGAERLVANLFQLTSAVSGIVNSSVDGNARREDNGLRIVANERYASDGQGRRDTNRLASLHYISLWPDVDCIPLRNDCRTSFSPALPLGWQISEPALQRLDSSVTKASYYQTTGDSIPGFGKILRVMGVR